MRTQLNVKEESKAGVLDIIFKLYGKDKLKFFDRKLQKIFYLTKEEAIKSNLQSLSFYIFQEEKGVFDDEVYFSCFLYFDIDWANEENFSLLEDKLISPEIPTPFAVIETGRHYAVLFLLKQPATREDIERYWYSLAQILQPEKILNEKNDMIRLPQTINEKSGKEVKWFVFPNPEPLDLTFNYPFLKEIKELKKRKEIKPEPEEVEIDKSKYEIIEEMNALYSFCNLFTILNSETGWEEDTYESWRFKSYFYAKEGKRAEFIKLSQLWKYEVVQKASERYAYSRRELSEGKADFWSCKSLSKFSLEELNEKFSKKKIFYSHPCSQCAFSFSILRAWEQRKFRLSFGKYIEKGGDIYKTTGKDEKLIATNFYPLSLEKEEFENEFSMKILLYDKEQKKIRRYDVDDNSLYAFLNADKSNLKPYLIELYAQNKDYVEIKRGFSGYWLGEWNILGEHYKTPLGKNDVERAGNFNDFADAFAKIISKRDIVNFIIAYSLLSLYLNHHKNLPFSPMLFVEGEAGIGKTLRGKIANALWRHPDVYLHYSAISVPFIQTELARIKSFLLFDEFFMKNDISLLYELPNRVVRQNLMYEAKTNFTSGVMITSEKGRAKFMLQGLRRRWFFISIEKKIDEELIKLYQNLTRNYGFLYRFKFSFKKTRDIKIDDDKREFVEMMISLMMEFAKQLGTDLVEDEVVEMFLAVLGKKEVEISEYTSLLLSALYYAKNQLRLQGVSKISSRLVAEEILKNAGYTFDKSLIRMIIILLGDWYGRYSDGHPYSFITTSHPFILNTTDTEELKRYIQEVKERIENLKREEERILFYKVFISLLKELDSPILP